jgi:hypothetical protein
MNGQWVGPYAGNSSGLLVIELDDVGDHYDGFVYAYDRNPSLPSVLVTLSYVPKTEAHFVRKLPLSPIDRNGYVLTEDQVKDRYPGVSIPKHFDTEWQVTASGISMKWITDVRDRSRH